MTELIVDPKCLMFFIDETGHEEFCDPNYPVFGIGGCAIMAGLVDRNLKLPWRELKERYFNGADRPLHAADLINASQQQMEAIGQFFRNGKFGRFAVTMTNDLDAPENMSPIALMPNTLRRRWEEIVGRHRPLPTELAFLHESSERGDQLIEKYFGKTLAQIDGRELKVHHGFMAKSTDEALEVADFVIHAAGCQANASRRGLEGFRKDFDLLP